MIISHAIVSKWLCFNKTLSRNTSGNSWARPWLPVKKLYKKLLKLFASGLARQIWDSLHWMKPVATIVWDLWVLTNKTSPKLPTVKLENTLSTLHRTLCTEDMKVVPPTLCRWLCHTLTLWASLSKCKIPFQFHFKGRISQVKNPKWCYFKIKTFCPLQTRSPFLHNGAWLGVEVKPWAILLSKGI